MSACIFLIIFSLTINLVSMLGVFNVELPVVNPDSTISTGGTNLSTLISSTSVIDIFTSVAGGAVLAGAIVVGAVCVFSGNYAPLAVYLFSVFFWGSWYSSQSYFISLGYFDSPPMLMLNMIIMAVMTCLFFVAIIGIWRGSD